MTHLKKNLWAFERLQIMSSSPICVRRASSSYTGLEKPWGHLRLRVPDFPENQYMKVVRLSAVCTGRLYPPWDTPGTHYCQRLSRTQGHFASRRIKSMKMFNDPHIESNLRTIAVPKPNASPRIPVLCMLNSILSCVVRRIFAIYPRKSVFKMLYCPALFSKSRFLT